MSNGGEVLSPEQSLIRCRELDQERESLLLRQAAMKERQAAAQRESQALLQEMTQLGTSPQTIQADLTAAREKLSKDTQEYQTRLAQARSQLDAAEQSLNQLESQRKK
jgi:uncharacterized protein (UPF0147 family)